MMLMASSLSGIRLMPSSVGAEALGQPGLPRPGEHDQKSSRRRCSPLGWATVWILSSTH